MLRSVYIGAADEEREFIASDASDHPGVAAKCFKPRTDLPEQPITDHMAKNVVDGLEIVEVDDRNGDGLVFRQGSACFGSLEKSSAVGKARQIVGVGDDLRARRFRQGTLLGFLRSPAFRFDGRARADQLNEPAFVGAEQPQDETDDENEAEPQAD